MTKKNLVLGTALGYDVSKVEAFVCSFREINSIDDMILFVDPNINFSLKSFLRDHNIQTTEFKNTEFLDTIVHNRRYVEFLDFLLDSNYDKVLLTDTRDVVFQSDPFVDLKYNGVYLCLEDAAMTIGSCRYNSYWIGSAYGPDILQELSSKNIICCGTILGPRTEVIKYLIKYKQALLQIKSRSFDVYSKTTVDQAIANYIGHIAYQPLNFVYLSNGNIVGTIGHSLCFDQAKDQIVLKNGKIQINYDCPAVIHQYDRHQKLADFYSLKYSQGINLTSSVK